MYCLRDLYSSLQDLYSSLRVSDLLLMGTRGGRKTVLFPWWVGNVGDTRERENVEIEQSEKYGFRQWVWERERESIRKSVSRVRSEEGRCQKNEIERSKSLVWKEWELLPCAILHSRRGSKLLSLPFTRMLVETKRRGWKKITDEEGRNKMVRQGSRIRTRTREQENEIVVRSASGSKEYTVLLHTLLVVKSRLNRKECERNG